MIDERNRCRFAVFDADSDAGLLHLLEVQEKLSHEGIASYLEGSRRGGHLRVFLASLVAAALLRRWLRPYCPAGVEFYPKQDAADALHPGSLVRVPFGVHRLTARRYPFVSLAGGRLVPVSRSLSDSLTWLASVRRVSLPADVLSGEADQRGEPPIQKKYTAKTRVPVSNVAPPLSIRQWCAQQNPFAVIGRYVELNQRGMGCCPFGWHHAQGRDTRPSLKVYAPKVAGGYCWYCHAWGQGGSVFDFLLLYHRFDTRELWQRILTG